MRDHGSNKGEAHKFVKASKPNGDPMTYKGDQVTHEKDRDSTAMAEGQNLDFPTSPTQDRYKLASTFRVKAFQKGVGK